MTEEPDTGPVGPEETTVATRTADLQPWVRSDHSPDTPPPHRAPWDTSEGPVALSVVWADAGHEVPVRAVDWDGCTATVKRP